ncbi:MAG: tRNA adenosine(34) deaminase TadA [Acutalibacteraceae bacterium]
MNCNNYNQFMQNAIDEAKKARSIGEVPVGAVIVFENKIIGSGYNKRETSKNALSHAEIEAINEACKTLGSWRLLNCDLYVTLEPCPMCIGAIINSRIKKVVFGCADPKSGSCGSLINLTDLPYNHRPEIVSGIMKDECSTLLSDFFKNLRKTKLF